MGLVLGALSLGRTTIENEGNGLHGCITTVDLNNEKFPKGWVCDLSFESATDQ